MNDDLLLKARLAVVIAETRSDVSTILSEFMRDYTLDQLLGYIRGLGYDIEITVRRTQCEGIGRLSMIVTSDE